MAIKFRRQRNDAMCQWATSTVATATSVPSPNLNPIDSFSVKFKHLLRKAAARSTETIRVMIGEILRARPPNAPTISETHAMPNPKSIML